MVQTPGLGKCDCCKKRDAIGVASVPGAPISVAWCSECVASNVIPWDIAVAMASDISSWDDCAEWFKEIVRNTCLLNEKTLDDFHQEVTKAKEDYERYLADRSSQERQ